MIFVLSFVKDIVLQLPGSLAWHTPCFVVFGSYAGEPYDINLVRFRLRALNSVRLTYMDQ